MGYKFSIVIPTYNRSENVLKTLESCFAQTFQNIEIIVVNDGSTDDTVGVLEQIHDDRLKVINQKNQGPAAARNTGMKSATGDYIAFLDSDDIWYPDFLENAHQQLLLDDNVVLYGQIIVDRGVGRYWIKPDRALGAEESIYDFLYVHGGFIQTSTMIIPKTLREKVSWDAKVTFGDNDQFAIDCWHTGIEFKMMDQPYTLYADIISPDALSQLPIYAGESPKYTNFFHWMNTQKKHMSPQAWSAYEARFLSVGLARKQPVKSINLLWKAYRSGAMSVKGMIRQCVQNFFPKSYRRLVDRYVALRGLRLEDIKGAGP